VGPAIVDDDVTALQCWTQTLLQIGQKHLSGMAPSNAIGAELGQFAEIKLVADANQAQGCLADGKTALDRTVPRSMGGFQALAEPAT
jgi:hypothetical protein